MIRAAVVGGGWAGLAAAVALTDAGRAVTLVEAAPELGGRARGLTIDVDGSACDIDNGQHLLLGAYDATFSLLRTIGVEPEQVLRRAPMRLVSTGGLRLEPAVLPAPLHLAVGLARARGLSWRDKAALAAALLRLRRRGWRVAGVPTVAAWLDANAQPATLRERLWEPLCVAALNTAPADACAQTFANVLRDSLGGGPRDADFVLPRATLGDVLPRPARRWLEARGARVQLRTLARAIAPATEAGAAHRLETNRGMFEAEEIVVAVPPPAAARILAGALPPAALAPFEGFAFESIATVYLFWRREAAPALPPWTLLCEDPARGEFGQWLFDRGDSGVWRVAGVVISAHGRDASPPGESLAATVARQVATQLGGPAAHAARTIVEKRATYRCTPGRPQLAADSLAGHLPRVALAGDHVWAEYPATIESAVRSGLAAARFLVGVR